MIIFTVRPYVNSDLESLIKVYKSAFAEPPWNESWKDEDVISDLEFALSQESPLVLVAYSNNNLLGFTWGYKIPLEKFPFLQGKIDPKSSYMDEIAVSGFKRQKGIGRRLCNEYINQLLLLKIPEIILRTDERNCASMGLFKSCGLKSINIYDPEYKDRIYLYKKLGVKNEN